MQFINVAIQLFCRITPITEMLKNIVDFPARTIDLVAYYHSIQAFDYPCFRARPCVLENLLNFDFSWNWFTYSWQGIRLK